MSRCHFEKIDGSCCSALLSTWERTQGEKKKVHTICFKPYTCKGTREKFPLAVCLPRLAIVCWNAGFHIARHPSIVHKFKSRSDLWCFTGVEHRRAVASILFESTMWAHAKPCVDAFNDEKLAKVKEVNSHDLLPGRRQMACVRKKTIRECAVGRLCRVHVALKNIAVRHMLRQLLWLTS